MTVTQTRVEPVPLLCYLGAPGSGKTHALLAEANRCLTSGEQGLAETVVVLCPDTAQTQALRHTVGPSPLRVLSAREFSHSVVAAFPSVAQTVMNGWGTHSGPAASIQPSPDIDSADCSVSYATHFVEAALLVALARSHWLVDSPIGVVDNEAVAHRIVRAWLADGPSWVGGGPALTQVMAHPAFQLAAQAPSPQALAQAVAQRLMAGVKATRLVPQQWADTLAWGVVGQLQARQLGALVQWHQQLKGLFIDDLPRFSPELQALFQALLPYGVALVATGNEAGIAHWLAQVPTHPRTLETLPLITPTAPPASSLVATLPDRLPGMTAWQARAFADSPFPPAGTSSSVVQASLSWLSLHQPETFEDEVALVCQALQPPEITHDDDDDNNPSPWTLVVPSRLWQAQWIDALSLAGRRDPATAHRLRVQSSLLSAAKVWLSLFQAAFRAREESSVDDLTPQAWADQVLPYEAIIGPQHQSLALGQITQTAWRACQQGDPMAHWLPALLTQWWQHQGQSVSLPFWNALHQVLLRPLGQALPVIARVAKPGTAAFLALVLAKLTAQPEPLASDEGLPCRVLTLKQAQGLWLGRVMLVSVMEPPVNPLALLQTATGVSPMGELVFSGSEDDQEDEGRNESTLEPPLMLADLLPPLLHRAGEAVWVSTHHTTQHTGYTPSPLVEAMAQAARHLSGQPWPLTPSLTAANDTAPHTPLAPEPIADWNTLPPAPESQTPLWPTGEMLPLSPTGIETYMRCPRQFYYKALLRLPDDVEPQSNEGISALLVGQLAHKVLELFNRQVTPQTHTVEHLLALAEPLLAVDRHRHDPPPAAFADSRVYQQFRRLSPLEQAEVKTKILASLADLAPQGYFDRPISQVLPEIRLNNVVLPELPQVNFTLAADALLQRPGGQWDLIDYKTYGSSAFGATSNTNAQKLAATLDPLDEAASTHIERFPKKDLQHKKRLVQLPLYYFAFSANPASVGQEALPIGRLALQVLRPPKDGDPKTGSVTVELPVAEVEAHRTRWLNDLSTGVVRPITQSGSFDPSPEPAQCASCPYLWLCDSAPDGDDLDGGGGLFGEGGESD
jgi:PD-(D/E)XK nuclease superfamily